MVAQAAAAANFLGGTGRERRRRAGLRSDGADGADGMGGADGASGAERALATEYLGGPLVEGAGAEMRLLFATLAVEPVKYAR